MAIKFVVVVFASGLLAAVALAQQQQQQQRTPQARRFGGNPLNLEPEQPMPQPFRRVSVPLFRGRGFSLQDGQEPKTVAPQPQQLPPAPAPHASLFQPRPVVHSLQTPPALESGEGENGEGGGRVQQQPQPSNNVHDEVAATAIVPQPPTRLQNPPPLPQEQPDRVQPQQANNRIQQQYVDRVQQQSEKPHPSFRPQPQIPAIQSQLQTVRRVVQRPFQKHAQPTEEATVTSRSPEMIQRLKHERTESADKQRAKKPVSQVLRRYRDDNPDGSITWGFENDDGTFKEETIGADCVTRGRYGYVDPEGVKREYSYQSGQPCDKNRSPESAGGQQQQQQQEQAQASDTRGYVDYTKNQYVMANGQTISLNGVVRNRARKPVARKPPQQGPSPTTPQQ